MNSCFSSSARKPPCTHVQITCKLAHTHTHTHTASRPPTNPLIENATIVRGPRCLIYCLPAFLQTDTYTQTQTRTHRHTHTPSSTHTHTHTLTSTHMHTQTSTIKHPHKHTHPHRQAPTNTHTHAHEHPHPHRFAHLVLPELQQFAEQLGPRQVHMSYLKVCTHTI
jgi:cell division septation protein DedD